MSSPNTIFICKHCGAEGRGRGPQKYHTACAVVAERKRKLGRHRRISSELLAIRRDATGPKAWFEVTATPHMSDGPRTVINIVSIERTKEFEIVEGVGNASTRMAMSIAREWCAIFGWDTKKSIDNATPYSGQY